MLFDPAEDVSLHRDRVRCFLRVVYFQYWGGMKEQASIVFPENERKYPEPNTFGTIPSGFYLRHLKNVEMSDIEIATIRGVVRPAFVLDVAKGADFFHVKTPHGPGSLSCAIAKTWMPCGYAARATHR